MKFNCELYINGQKVDIINNAEFAQQFAITYSFSDLLEPDKITDSYSKTINIPGTANNNKIFGNIWRFDADNMDQFNPSLLSDFKILMNGELWYTGTAQLTGISIEDNNVMYSVVLYGSITKVMSILLNGDLDDPNNRLLRSLKFPNKLRHTLNISNMSDFWNEPSLVYEDGVRISDYMNYVPCQNGLYENFDNSKKVTSPALSSQLRIEPYVVYSSTIDSGTLEFNEYQTSEYRLEYQRPAVKVGAMINQIVSDVSTDASIHLDSSFFSDMNPYFEDTYMTLSQFTTDADEGNISADGTIQDPSAVVLEVGDDSVVFGMYYKQIDGAYQFFDSSDYSTAVHFNAITGNKTVSVEFMVRASALLDGLSPQNSLLMGTPTRSLPTGINNYNPARWTVYAEGYAGASSVSTGQGISVTGIPDTLFRNLSGADTTVNGRSTYYNYLNADGSYGNYRKYTMNQYSTKFFLSSYTAAWEGGAFQWKPFKIDIPASTLLDEGYIAIWIEDISHDFCHVSGTNIYSTSQNPVLIEVRPVPHSTGNPNDFYPASYGWTGNSATVTYDNTVRSNIKVNQEDLFDTTTTQGEILLGYTKLLGCIYDTDRDGNITIMPRNKFFENYRILDWSDKIDYSRGISMKPLTFDSKYLEMKYVPGDSYYEKKYRGEFGLEYAEQKINTGYQFGNTEPVQLLDTPFMNTIIASEPKYKYSMGVSGRLDASFLGEVPMPAYFDKDGTTKTKTEGKYGLLFRKENLHTTYKSYITADMPQMLTLANGGSYCWIDCTVNNSTIAGYRRAVQSVPQYTTHVDNLSWEIGYPRISYEHSSPSSYPQSSTVYYRFWKDYIEEIYNVRNKVMTCWVSLDFTDMMNFSFRDFVTINGNIWHVNKIINYNPLSDDPTQVELVKVSNIDAYVSGQRYDDLV